MVVLEILTTRFLATYLLMATYLGNEVPDIVVKSLFSKYDNDSSGSLSPDEVKTLLVEDLAISKDEVDAFALLMDRDASNRVTLEEFTKWLRDPNQSGLIRDPTGSKYHTLLQAVDYFRQYDVDQSGALETNEFSKLMQSLQVKEEAVAAALNGIDKDHNGKISFNEFLKWLNWIPIDDL